MPDSSGGKLCPICDSPLQPGSKKCGFCGTDLSIFEIDMEPAQKAPEPVPSPPERPSIHAKVEEVLSRPPPAPAARVLKEEPEPPRATVRPAAASQTQAEPTPVAKEEPIEEPEPTASVAPAEEQKADAEVQAAAEFFECPQCGANVEITANSCPKCGVLFAEEGADMFQCPACNTLVSVDAKSCPGCGAMFVEPEAAAPEVREPAKPLAAPKPEVSPPIEEARSSPEAPEKAEEKAPVLKGLFGKFKLGRKEKPAEPERKEEVPRTPEPEAPAVSERRLATRAKPAPPASEVNAPQAAPVAPAAEVREAPAAPAMKDKGKELARMVAEMKPLLALAREREVEIGESKDLIDEAALAGRERQLDKAIELVQESKVVLMEKIDSHLGQVIGRLNEDIKVAREFGGDISRAATFMQELARARSSRDIEAAFVYVDKVEKELAPITGRYNESKKKVAGAKQFIADCEMFLVDTKDARRLLVEANKALEAKDFDKLDAHLKGINDSLYKAIPARMNEEMAKAREDLLDAKVKGVNITPMLTVLKSATSLMKSGDYTQAIREMREFKTMMKKPT